MENNYVEIMKRILIIFTAIILCDIAMAQSITNVDCHQDGKSIVITYTLQGTRDADISLSYSTNGGTTYTKLKSVTGNVGKQSPGSNKSVKWDVLADVDKLVEDNVTFRVDAKAVYTGSTAKSSSSSNSYNSYLSNSSSSRNSSSAASSSSNAGQADYEKGYKYELAKNYSSAITYYRKAAAQGHKEAKKRIEALQLYFW